MNIRERIAENATLVENALREYLSEDDADFHTELEAERYSVFGKAKRIRPTLTLEFCRLFGGTDAAALPFAAAVEMVHTYSLIHDDLPCMDDDDLRRGRPTCHRQFGESTALLAGDGLLTRAFGVAASNTEVSDLTVRAAILALSRAAGSFGMIGGQVMDLASEHRRIGMEELLKLHAHKTGALISVSTLLGCLAAGLTPEDRRTEASCRFAGKIGLAFQVVDDILDVTASAKELGKSVGSDAAHEKNTFLSYYSVGEAEEYAAVLTAEAKKELDGIDGTEVLLALADSLAKRKF